MDTDTVTRLRVAISRLSRQLNASATHEGLTPSQASALGLIGGRGLLSLAELAKLESLNPTMVSRIVGRLDELGLIRRRQNPDDLRAAWVEITDDGRRMTARIRESRGQVVADCLARLDQADLAAITAALPALEHLVDELKSATTTQD